MSTKMKRYLAIGIFIPVLILAALLSYAQWAWGGSIQTTLASQYIPTAEYLIRNPIPTPSFIQNIVPVPASIISTGDQIYITIDPHMLNKAASDISEWTRIFVNHQRLSSSDYGVALTGQLGEQKDNGTITFSLHPKLDSGLHIVEIRIGASISDLITLTQSLSYNWVYKVD